MMDITRLIDELSCADAYCHPVGEVEVHQTHISVVFLAGLYAYKVKKAVNFGFVDFSTLERRRFFCDEEIRLNRRLAPGVYLGVVPITRLGDRVMVEGAGEIVEWAVKMERLDETTTMRHQLQAGQWSGAKRDRAIGAIVTRMVGLYDHADHGSAVVDAAGFEAVSKNAEDNFNSSEPLVGRTVSRAVIDRLRELTRLELERLQPLIDARANRRIPRDGHGDLRLDHIYFRRDREPPNDLVIVDCIEFSDRLRSVDPVSDLAFLAMDLLSVQGDRAGANCVIRSYEKCSSDVEGRPLWGYFVAYRAMVRAKVDGLAALQPERSDRERADAVREARGHWLLALGELESANRKPCLALVAGPPGVGKSTLARGLADRAGFEVIRSDVVRKGLAGLRPEQAANAELGAGIYTQEWTERTYEECYRLAKSLLFEGRRVIVDASFARESQRVRFLKLARESGVPGVFLDVVAPLATIQERLAERSGDVSDAGPEIGVQAFGRWDAVSDPIVKDCWMRIDSTKHTSKMIEDALSQLARVYGLSTMSEQDRS